MEFIQVVALPVRRRLFLAEQAERSELLQCWPRTVRVSSCFDIAGPWALLGVS